MMKPGLRRTAGAQAARVALVALSGAIAAAAGGVVLLFAFGLLPQPGPSPRPKAAQATVPSAPAPAVAIVRPLPMPRDHQVSAQRARDGQFYLDTAVNGLAVRMMFDTGASLVVLRAEDAVRAGVNVNALTFNVTTQTANGTGAAAFVTLDALRVGDIVRRNIPALVLKPGKLGISLLGQSFMSKLAGYRYEGGELILQGN